MIIHSLDTGLFKLDGGAMFGVVPKSIWHKLNPADDNNMCTWAMRCLLIEEGNTLMLIDTGIGNKQDAKFFSHYYLHGEGSLKGAIQKAGYSPNEVTDVLLTHLHFDHCGGSTEYQNEESKTTQPSFKNAKYWSNEAHWNWAVKPNPREKASFLPLNILSIEESGALNYITEHNKPAINGLEIIQVDGHTEKQMLPLIPYKGYELLFCADLFPSYAHIPLPYVMSYDIRPLLTMQEREMILSKAADNEKFILVFEHDHQNECATIKRTEKGFAIDKLFPLSAL